MSAGNLSLWIAALFLVGSVATLMRTASPTARLAEGRRALIMAALFGAVSTGFLWTDLARVDLQVRFVAGHVLVAMPLSSRLVSIVGDPSGAGLLAGALVPVIALAGVRRESGRWSLVAIAALTLVLVAAPLAGTPHALLDYIPADGQPVTPFARHPLAWGYLVALAAAPGVAMIALARALDSGDSAERQDWAIRLTVAWLATVLLVTHAVSTMVGIEREATRLGARGGAWGVLVVVLVCARLASASSDVRGRVAASLSLVLASLSVVLSAAAWQGFTAAGWLLLGSAVVVALAGVWGAVRAASRPTLLAVVTGSVLLAALLAGLLSRVQRGALEPGATLLVAGESVAHQGLSVYDEPGAAVLALALEARSGNNTRLDRAEQREFTDARGAVVGGVWTRPATFAGWRGTTRIWLDSASRGDRAHLTTAIEWGAWLWWVLVLLVWLDALRPSALARVRPAIRPPG